MEKNNQKNNQNYYDIAIVGAGPAGATFAKLLAEQKPDLKIVLLHDHQPERQKPCGGLLSPDAQKKLAEHQITLPKEILADPQIFAVRTVDLKQNLDCTYQRHYLNMDRYAFDEWLISLIPNKTTIMRQRYIKVIREDNDFILTLSSGQVLRSHYLVAADGAGSSIRRTFFPEKKTNNYTAIQQWFKRKDFDRAEFYCVFDPETSDSYSWFFNKNEYIVYGGAFPKQNSRELFEAQKSKFAKQMNYDLSDLVRTEACQVVFPRKFNEFFLGKENIFLLGEAAGLISASSFEGISYAIDSAEKLANAFAKVPIHSKPMKYYQNAMRKMKIKLWLKMHKRNILCQPFLRRLIMKSKITAINLKE